MHLSLKFTPLVPGSAVVMFILQTCNTRREGSGRGTEKWTTTSTRKDESRCESPAT